MLILRRMTGQRIIIGKGADAVVITLVDAGPGRASIGITAPLDVRVLRSELLNQHRRDSDPDEFDGTIPTG